jgi:hypothetical protein
MSRRDLSQRRQGAKEWWITLAREEEWRIGRVGEWERILGGFSEFQSPDDAQTKNPRKSTERHGSVEILIGD